MNFVEAIILAIIEGFTEFLPISSTGHLIVASSFMGIASQDFTKTFTVTIQLGAILSVMVAYWRRFLKSFRFYIVLLVGFVPALLLGLLLGSWIDAVMDRVDIVGYSLLTGGIFLLFVDKFFEKNEALPQEDVSYRKAFFIGLFQCIAILLPGISRSAASIIGGLTQKLNRKTAAEFSFLLAVPTMFGATAYKLFMSYSGEAYFSSEQIKLLVVGNVVAFLVAWLALRTFIRFLTKYGFKFFGYYRIVAGLVILVLYYAGYSFSVL